MDSIRNLTFLAARNAVSPSNEDTFTLKSGAVSRALCYSVLLGTIPIVLFCLLSGMLHGHPTGDYLSCAVAIAFVFLCEALAGIPVARLFSVQVCDRGITSTDFWGRPLTLSWGEIETVETKQFLNLSYLKVASFRNDRAALCLPLFVQSPEGLRTAVAHHAAPHNPLRRVMEHGEQEARREPIAW